jgi:flagellar hook-basal body complex protein FliE
MDVTASIAAQAYARARPATTPTEPAGGADRSVAQGFTRLADSFAQTVQRGEETAKAAMTGRADAHALVEALAATELAVETAVTVRDRVVEAYQEILRMPV